MSTQRRSYVLGISGGVDSLAAALLAQEAVRRARKRGHDARFIAMRLPYGVQADEDDAQRSLALIDQPADIQELLHCLVVQLARQMRTLGIVHLG